MDKPMDVLRDFPIRKTKKQKAAFREAVLSYASSLGYACKEERGSMGAVNILIGDVDAAKVLVTAHYDTCAVMPVPNFITPCNFLIYLLYQLLITVVIIGGAGLAGGLIGGLLSSEFLAIFLAEVFLFGLFALLIAGPANKNNANDNTSGVVSVLETAAALSEEQRKSMAFVLFDLEEAGLIGSSAYRKAHRKASVGQLILNVDCAGDGRELMMVPTKKLKKQAAQLERLQQLCPPEGERLLYVKQKGFAFYPSDQSNFPYGLGIAAFHRKPVLGLYLSRIHTKRDTILDENNVALLRDYFLRVVDEAAKERN